MQRQKLCFVLVLLFATLLTAHAETSKCDQERGLRFLDSQKFDQAFKALEYCEYESGISADALFGLSQLYSNKKFGALNAQDRQRKVWELIHRSAVAGHPEALRSLVWIYSNGDELIPLKSNPPKADCLKALYEQQNVEDEAIRMCLSIS